MKETLRVFMTQYDAGVNLTNVARKAQGRSDTVKAPYGVKPEELADN